MFDPVPSNRFRKMRRALVSAAAATLALGIGVAHAQASRPITIVVPFAAGGATDITARLVAERLTQSLKTSVVVDNKAGANSQIGTSFVINARPDGHTLLMGTTSLINNIHLYPRIQYDASRELRPVAGVVEVPAFLMVGPNVKAKNTREFVSMAKASKGALNYASAGAGSTLHLAAEWFRNNVGFDATHVPQRGSGPAVVALAQGQVDFSFENYGPALPQIQANRLRVLAIASPKRFPSLPDVPTLKEAGIDGPDLASWFVLMAPAGTPDDVVANLNKEVNAVLAQPDVRQRLLDIGLVPLGGTPQDVTDRMRQDSGKWGSIIRTARVKVE
ncbi:Bug family tripartite tricarboxylate transporter substrate binding protein [Ramlibacter sp.]|uniref:Bug family tripartite tricarboxylate transporter substrate binding protein n=1 Tax=Ramlibacter sp. TaxID=1917967 RepID=UPI003D09AC16